MPGREKQEVRRAVPQWQDSAALAALDELTRVSIASTGALARRAHLSETEVQALRHLMDEEVGPAELARILGVTSAAATGIVDRLEARGHVERHPHPSDRRRTLVDLTDSGRREMIGLLAPMFAGLAEADAELDGQGREIVARFLTRATQAIRATM